MSLIKTQIIISVATKKTTLYRDINNVLWRNPVEVPDGGGFLPLAAGRPGPFRLFWSIAKQVPLFICTTDVLHSPFETLVTNVASETSGCSGGGKGTAATVAMGANCRLTDFSAGPLKTYQTAAPVQRFLYLLILNIEIDAPAWLGNALSFTFFYFSAFPLDCGWGNRSRIEIAVYSMYVSSRGRPDGVTDFEAEWPNSPSRSPSRYLPPAPRQRLAGPPAAVPQLGEADAGRVTVLLAELTRETSQLLTVLTPPKLTRGPVKGPIRGFSSDEMREAAETLIRYRVESLGVMRQTERESRSTFARDLREGDRRTFPHMRLLLQILGHFSPPTAA